MAAANENAAARSHGRGVRRSPGSRTGSIAGCAGELLQLIALSRDDVVPDGLVTAAGLHKQISEHLVRLKLAAPVRAHHRSPQIPTYRLEGVRPLLVTKVRQPALSSRIWLGEQRAATCRAKRLRMAVQIIDVGAHQAVLQSHRA